MVDFTVLILPHAFGAGVAIALDILNAASAIAPRWNLPQPRWRLVSPDGGWVTLSSGMQCTTVALPRRSRVDRSTWIVPGLNTHSPTEVSARLAGDDATRAVAALSWHAARGGAVAASCSAVFLLQAAGLLRGRRVTTSWWLAPELRRLEPQCIVDADRMVCSDGPVITAGAALAQADLMLHLLRARLGAEAADAISRVLLLDARRAQAPFAAPTMMPSRNELLRRLTQRIESSFPSTPSVAALAKEFAMSQRTLSRHVRGATGQGALALIQGVRLNRARTLIETSRLSIEQVAHHVGYEDATALRRLMRKAAGATPSQFRSSLYAD